MGNRQSISTYNNTTMNKDDWIKKMEEDKLLRKWIFNGSKFGCIMKDRSNKLSDEVYTYNDIYGNELDVDYVTIEDSDKCYLVPVLQFISNNSISASKK